MRPGSLTTIHVEDRSTGSSQTSAVAARSSAHDLWSLAFEQLDADKKSVLNFAQAANDADSSSPIDIITSVIEQTERSYAAYKNTGWRIRYRNGEEVNVRRQAKNILTSALAFKGLIDSAVAFDPSGHAATAWGIVAFGLSLMQNDRDRTEKIFESSAFLASVLLRYRSIETYYLSRPLQDSSQLEKAIIDVYVAVLEYTAAVRTTNQANLAKRVLQAFQALSGQPLQTLQAAITSKDATVKNGRI